MVIDGAADNVERIALGACQEYHTSDIDGLMATRLASVADDIFHHSLTP